MGLFVKNGDLTILGNWETISRDMTRVTTSRLFTASKLRAPVQYLRSFSLRPTFLWPVVKGSCLRETCSTDLLPVTCWSEAVD